MFQGFVDEWRPNYLVFFKEELEAQDVFNRMEKANFTLLKEWVDEDNGKERHLRVYRSVGGKK